MGLGDLTTIPTKSYFPDVFSCCMERNFFTAPPQSKCTCNVLFSQRTQAFAAHLRVLHPLPCTAPYLSAVPHCGGAVEARVGDGDGACQWHVHQQGCRPLPRVHQRPLLAHRHGEGMHACVFVVARRGMGRGGVVFCSRHGRARFVHIAMPRLLCHLLPGLRSERCVHWYLCCFPHKPR